MAYDLCVKGQTTAIGAEIGTTANCATGLVSYSLPGKVRASISAPGSDVVVDGPDAETSHVMLLDQFNLLRPAAAPAAGLGGC